MFTGACLTGRHIEEGVVLLEEVHSDVDRIAGVLGPGVGEQGEVAGSLVVGAVVIECRPVDEEFFKVKDKFTNVLGASLLVDAELERLKELKLVDFPALLVELNVLTVEDSTLVSKPGTQGTAARYLLPR